MFSQSVKRLVQVMHPITFPIICFDPSNPFDEDSIGIASFGGVALAIPYCYLLSIFGP